MSSEHESAASREAPSFITGSSVVDARFGKAGKVTDVIFDDRGAATRWAVVKTGVLSGEHLIPLDDTYVAEDGRLVVPFDRTTIKRAPRVSRDHILTPEIKRSLRDYYGVAA